MLPEFLSLKSGIGGRTPKAGSPPLPSSTSSVSLTTPVSDDEADAALAGHGFVYLDSYDGHGDEFDIDLDSEGLDVSKTRLDPDGEAGFIQLETRGVSSHDLQGQLWSSQSVFKHSIVAKLREVRRSDLWTKLDECHSRTTYVQCDDCRGVSKFQNRCDLFYCPECQPKLARERKESVEWWTREIGQPKHVVLTLRNIPTLTKGHVQEVKKMFGRLRRTKFARGWKGGFYSLECTNESKGWHLHIHALIDCKWVDARLLSAEWEKATRGMGYIVKVKDCRNKSYLQEVTKYAVKGSDLSKWSPSEIAMFVDAFKGVRSFGVFGALHGKRTEWKLWIESLKEQKAKCKCGCNNVRFFSEHEWLLTEISSSPGITSIPPPKVNHLEFSFIGQLSCYQQPD